MKSSVALALACCLAASMLQSDLAVAKNRLRKASRHFRDYYFLAFDETRVDVGAWNGVASETWANRSVMEAVADELTLGTTVERLGLTFLRPPQGFRVTGTEEAVLALARDKRVKWVEEVGPFLRALEARPGEYSVLLQPLTLGAGRIHRTEVRRVAEELASCYGGRLTKHIWEAGPVGFGLENASEESARAMSEDPRVEFVEENPAGTIDVPTVKVDIDLRGSGERFRRSPRPNPGTYVVSLRDGGPRHLRSAAVREIGKRLTARYGGSVRSIFELSTGFSINATEGQAIAMSEDDEVEYVGEDTILVMDPSDLPPPRR